MNQWKEQHQEDFIFFRKRESVSQVGIPEGNCDLNEVFDKFLVDIILGRKYIAFYLK